MTTKEELRALKEEAETLNAKSVELSDEELKAVSGGTHYSHRQGGKPVSPNDSCPKGTCGSCGEYHNGACSAGMG